MKSRKGEITTRTSLHTFVPSEDTVETEGAGADASRDETSGSMRVSFGSEEVSDPSALVDIQAAMQTSRLAVASLFRSTVGVLVDGGRPLLLVFGSQERKRSVHLRS